MGRRRLRAADRAVDRRFHACSGLAASSRPRPPAAATAVIRHSPRLPRDTAPEPALGAPQRPAPAHRPQPPPRSTQLPQRCAPAHRRTAAKLEAVPKTDAPIEKVADSGSIRVSVEKIDELMNTVGELVITQAMLSQLGAKLEGTTAEKLRAGLAQLERNMRELQESVMRVRMLPINVVFSRFPRMVRDLAQRLGKQIELKLTGEQTELDKTVLEKIGDPLVHLVRNSIDHGIETPEKRAAAGKSPAGTVHLDACHRGGNIAVEVSDDGGGLDKNRILAKARERGLVGANDVLTDEQIYELIFLPGFSTAEKTTDVSGRGVGMDVVRRNIKELGGKIELRSEYGKGSRTIITLPLTLAIVDGQSVSVGGETYIVPLISIVESHAVEGLECQPPVRTRRSVLVPRRTTCPSSGSTSCSASSRVPACWTKAWSSSPKAKATNASDCLWMTCSVSSRSSSSRWKRTTVTSRESPGPPSSATAPWP